MLFDPSSTDGLRWQVLENVRGQLAEQVGVLQRLIDAVALADVLCAMASAASADADGNEPYTRPRFSAAGTLPENASLSDHVCSASHPAEARLGSDCPASSILTQALLEQPSSHSHCVETIRRAQRPDALVQARLALWAGDILSLRQQTERGGGSPTTHSCPTAPAFT